MLCMTPSAHLKGKQVLRWRIEIRQARANYARRNTRGTVGGADGPPGVYKYIIYIYITLRVAFAPLAPQYITTEQHSCKTLARFWSQRSTRPNARRRRAASCKLRTSSTARRPRGITPAATTGSSARPRRPVGGKHPRGVWRVPIHSFRKRMLGGRHELGRRTTATFVPKLPVLPPELVRRVVEYAFHTGDY